jgi:hypothetical protein
MGPRAVLFTVVNEKNFQPPPGIEPYNPDRPARNLVAIPTELSLLEIMHRNGSLSCILVNCF